MKKIFYYITKKMTLVLMTLFLFGITCDAQVVFSKFKFSKDSPFGAFPGRKMTDTKFKVSSENAIKYVRVYYYAVNAVGDAVSSELVGGPHKLSNKKYVKALMINSMGPFEPGEKYSRWASGTITYPQKITAFPCLIELIYMNGEREEIEISEQNLKEYFPCIKKWIDVNLEDGF